MSSAAVVSALESLQSGHDWTAKGIRSVVWVCARSAVVDWIGDRSTKPELSNSDQLADIVGDDQQPIADLPAYVATLAPGLIRDAFALSRAADDATAQDILGGISRSTLWRRKCQLRQALAIMAPAE